MAFLIDLERVYDQTAEPECAGLKGLIETAIRKVFCRHCEDAPCVLSCPQDALKKMNEELKRSNFLCTGCRSCLIGCPFGVNIDEMVEYRRDRIPPLGDLIEACPWIERGEFEESEDTIRLDKDIFVRGAGWKKQLRLPPV